MTTFDRLADTVIAAEAGDAEAGRELLCIAAMQLRETGTLEPPLARYLAESLECVCRGQDTDAAKLLNIAGKSKPRNRPPNQQRKLAMHRALDIASEVMALDSGDISHLSAEASKIAAIENKDERAAQLIDWADEYSEARRQLNTTELFSLSASIFNRTLNEAQSKNQRLDEKPATAGAMKEEHYRRD